MHFSMSTPRGSGWFSMHLRSRCELMMPWMTVFFAVGTCMATFITRPAVSLRLVQPSMVTLGGVLAMISSRISVNTTQHTTHDQNNTTNDHTKQIADPPPAHNKRLTVHTHAHRQRTTPPTTTHTRREQHPKRTPPTSTSQRSKVARLRNLCVRNRGRGVGFGLYTILPSPILYGVWHANEGSVKGSILRYGRAIVSQ